MTVSEVPLVTLVVPLNRGSPTCFLSDMLGHLEDLRTCFHPVVCQWDPPSIAAWMGENKGCPSLRELHLSDTSTLYSGSI